jgi:hypothetical protein
LVIADFCLLFSALALALAFWSPRSGRDFFLAKSFDNLYPQLTDFGNPHLAWRKAARGKRGKPAAARFETNLADELIRLQDELTAETWQPGVYHSFTIRDPKQRPHCYTQVPPRWKSPSFRHGCRNPASKDGNLPTGEDAKSSTYGTITLPSLAWIPASMPV